jgi:histone H2B
MAIGSKPSKSLSPSAEATSKEAKTSVSTSSFGIKKKHKKRKYYLAIYIYKVLKQVHPETSISNKVKGNFHFRFKYNFIKNND